MKLKWHSTASIGVLIGTLLLGACAPAAQQSPTPPPKPQTAKPPSEKAVAETKPAAGGQQFAGKTLRVATWGADWGDGVKASAGTLFEQQTGAKVEYVFGNPSDNLTKLRSSRGDVPFDVMQMDNLTEELMIRDGLLEPVDHSKLPLNELFPEAVVTQQYGPAFTMIPTVIAWSPTKYRELGLQAPKSFDDLLDPKLKGRVAYPSMRVGFAPLIISGLAYGWAGDQMKVEEAMQKLKTIEPRVYGATPEMATWLTNGEVYAAVTHTAQVMVMKNQGFELDFVYPQIGDKQSMVYWNMTNIVKGTPNKDMAERWIAINLSPEAQELIGRRNGVVPTATKVAEEFSKDEQLKGLAVSPSDMAKMFQVDAKVINDNRDKWNDSWNRIMGS